MILLYHFVREISITMNSIKFRITPGAFFVSAVMLFCIPAGKLVNMLLAVTVHEMGHIIAIMLFGGKIKGVILGVGGLEIKSDTRYVSALGECIIALSGIFANLLCFTACEIFFKRHDFGIFCLLFAVLNSVPVCGFDVYRALEAMLPFKASWLRVISGISLFILWIISVYIMLIYPSNPSLFLLCVSVYLGSFGKKQS